MAESESIDCPCSNIAIMQLFHELKQSYPTVPDQIVSKVIQENYHDKSACETILQRESHGYPQSYPGAIISGNPRESQDRGALCSHCPAARPMQCNDVECSPRSVMPDDWTQAQKQNAFSTEGSGIYAEEKTEVRPQPENSHPLDTKIKKESCKEEGGGKCDKAENVKRPEIPPECGSSSSNSSRTLNSECDSDKKRGCSGESQGLKGTGGKEGYSEVETVRWNVEDGGRILGGSKGVITRPLSSEQTSVHNYQVAVQYSMQPTLLPRQGGHQRSFTTVNLSLRPPSSEPQPPIEIQSGQNLTYMTSVFDAKKGVESHLQIRIGPGGGTTVSACRTFFTSSPHARYACESPCCSAGFRCPNNHHLKALLEKQRERKDLLARELRKEKDKLRCMQNDVRLMKASIAQKPSPHLLPKLKAEIERLRAECERLTAAVDLYADPQNNLPLGETDEEFYRNIYTGQRLQREGSWSCQLCTFRNHPLLSVCEECEMPRISLERDSIISCPNKDFSHLDVGVLAGRRDIHIRVTHHCPPSRTVNSWVV